MYMENFKKYHGYLAFPRHAIMLHHDLGNSLFGFYLSLILRARWHRDNQYFGCVVGTQKEIAELLHISQSSLSRDIDKLSKKNKYYALKNKRYIRLGFFALFLKDVCQKTHSKNYVSLHDLYENVYKINSELQNNYARLQEK